MLTIGLLIWFVIIMVFALGFKGFAAVMLTVILGLISLDILLHLFGFIDENGHLQKRKKKD